MLDVLHYFFEEDAAKISTAEQGEARDAVRTQIYSALYDVDYKYSAQKTTKMPSDFELPLNDEEEERMPAPFDPAAGPTKRYTAPTSFDPDSPMPFGGALDAPLK